MSDWKKHVCLISKYKYNQDASPSELSKEESASLIETCRNNIEPWLSAVFQSEHLSLFVGNGLTTAIAKLADIEPPNMARIQFPSFKDVIKNAADAMAVQLDRGVANFEDDIRTALELLRGLSIIATDDDSKGDVKNLEMEVNEALAKLIKSIFKVESDFCISKKCEEALQYLKSFLVSFASRTATRDRLQIFTTNYDRFIEYGCDMAGILILDRFIGKIQPILRTTKLELDFHYNPPGIRGEPRYVEGVTRLTKLHGSIDWRFSDDKITQAAMSFGLDPKGIAINDRARQYVVYPNSSKDIETTYFPYAELFRDFSSAICRPNSTLITYGYGFGDSHINRIIEDMLTIPSTHVVIISYDGASGRISKFYNRNNPAQFTMLLGDHFGDFKTLVDNYLPKAAIDRLSIKMQHIKVNRGDTNNSGQLTQEEPEAQAEHE